MERFAVPNRMTAILMAGVLAVLGVMAIASLPTNGSMLILRGIAAPEAPRGQLDDDSAKALARKLGYSPVVLDIAADDFTGKNQVQLAVERIRNDSGVTALYGFSGGGYNAQAIWSQLNPEQRKQIQKIVVVGSPGVTPSAFPGLSDVIVQADPPEGHMAGPKVLLKTVSNR